MKNSKLRRVLMLVACAVMLVCLSVGATLAFLTDDTKVVTNTFTVGENISIDLDEAYVYAPGTEPERDDFGKINPDANPARGNENSYKLVPNWTYDKDPTVHINIGSGKCYLFVKVVNGIVDIEAEDNAEKGTYTIETQMLAKGWNKLTGVENADNVWFYGVTDHTNGDVIDNLFDEDGVTPATKADDYVVFENFTIENLTSIDSKYNGATVTIDAYAIQADGFSSAAEAWTAAPHDWTDPVTE